MRVEGREGKERNGGKEGRKQRERVRVEGRDGIVEGKETKRKSEGGRKGTERENGMVEGRGEMGE